ncbi:MAG: metallophosphoesterase [Ilumatobacter sp.]
MEYLLASDLHYEFTQLDWIAEQASTVDAVVLAGDHLDVGGRVDLAAQVAMMKAYFAKLADSTTVIVNSGNHDLSERRPDGEKAAAWLGDIDTRVHTDGDRVRVGPDLISVCAWWEGDATRGELEAQLERDADERDGAPWIWVYHSPPDASPTSWGGRRHFGDDVLNRLIETHSPDLVLTGHVHDSPFRSDGSWHDRIGETLVVNAGRHTGPMPAHAIIDTAAGSIEWWSSYDRGQISL